MYDILPFPTAKAALKPMEADLEEDEDAYRLGGAKVYERQVARMNTSWPSMKLEHLDAYGRTNMCISSLMHLIIVFANVSVLPSVLCCIICL